MIHFEIHNHAGRPLMSFDTEHRARQELARVRKIAAKAKLVRVTRVVEEMS